MNLNFLGGCCVRYGLIAGIQPQKAATWKWALTWTYAINLERKPAGHVQHFFMFARPFVRQDPFRGYPHVMVLADAWNAWDDQPAKNNSRVACAETMDMYRTLDPWFGIEQEYTLMKPGRLSAVFRFCLVGFFVWWLVGWLVGRWVGWLAGWLVGWSVGRVVGRSLGRWVGW